MRSESIPEAELHKSVHRRVLVHIAIRNLTSKKLRTFLTLFGVVIGVSAIFFLLTFGLGIQQLVTREVVGEQSLKSVELQSPSSDIVKIDEDLVNEIRRYAHVTSVGVQYSFPGIASVRGGEIDSVVYGVDQAYLQLSSLVTVQGRLLEKQDTKAVVVSESMLESLGLKDAKSAVGTTVAITVPLEKFDAREKEVKGEYTVVGVVSSTSGNELYIPSTVFDVAGVPSYMNAKIAVDQIENVDIIRHQVEAKGFETTSLTDTVQEIDNIFRVFTLILIGFGSIGMIVAVLGMFNTMTIALLERTKEIGLMMALGARQKDIQRLFTFEAVIISAAGAVIGMLIAYLAGLIVNLSLNFGAQSRGIHEWFEVFSTPWWAVVIVFFVTVVIGLLVVYFPARRAAKTNPIDALRRE